MVFWDKLKSSNCEFSIKKFGLKQERERGFLSVHTQPLLCFATIVGLAYTVYHVPKNRSISGPWGASSSGGVSDLDSSSSRPDDFCNGAFRLVPDMFSPRPKMPRCLQGVRC